MEDEESQDWQSTSWKCGRGDHVVSFQNVSRPNKKWHLVHGQAQRQGNTSVLAQGSQ